MYGRAQAGTFGVPTEAKATVRIDYPKLVAWIGAIALPWAGIVALERLVVAAFGS